MNRRGFAMTALCSALPFAALVLTGCSFSLRDFLHADARLVERDRPPDPAVSPVPEASEGVQYGFWMDTAACVGCGSCVDACREKNGSSLEGDARRALYRYELDGGSTRFVSISCMHCAKPACVEVCPSKAISKRGDGVVVVDQDRCVGCKYCHQACSFGIPRYSSKGMEKCDCCLGVGVPIGKDPHCVRACPAKALQYGTLQALAGRTGCPDGTLEAPTDPSFFLS